MAREQLGVCAEPNLHGLLLLFNVLEGHSTSIRQVLGLLPKLSRRLSEQFSESNLTSVIAIGTNYWNSYCPLNRPVGLDPIAAIQQGDMPITPIDLMLQLRADRYDVLHLAAQQCAQLLSPHTELVEQIHLFRFMDGRDLTGFIHETDAPVGRQKRKFACISEQSESYFHSGSYLFMQRYQLDLLRWQHLTQHQQEAIIGRYKLDGALLPSAQRLASSHAEAAATRDENEQTLPLIFQNMPFGDLTRRGWLVLGYSCQAEAYPLWLERRLGLLQNRPYDELLDYVQVDLGASFFVPSINLLEDLALQTSTRVVEPYNKRAVG